MSNRVAELVREIKIEQNKPRNEEKETDAQYAERLALEDEWIGGIYYKANSVSWSHSKSVRYRDDLGKVWEALNELGIKADGKTHIAEVIRGLKLAAVPL